MGFAPRARHGCVYGGSHTADDYHADEMVEVPAFGTYVSRPEMEVLDLPDIVD